MNRWEIVTAFLLAVVLAWLFWPRKAKRHDLGTLPPAWGRGHDLFEQHRRDRERRSDRG